MNDPKYAYPDPKYAYPYPAQVYHPGNYHGPPVMAPPPQYAAPPPRIKPGVLEGSRAAWCCCSLFHQFSCESCDPSSFFFCF